MVAGWLHILFLFFHTIFKECRHQFIGNLKRRPHLIGNFGQEDPFYWQIRKRRHHSIGKRLAEFSYLCPKLCLPLVGVSFYGPCSTWRAGRLEQVILLAWPYLV